MIRFDSDYVEGCIPEILEALQKSNEEQTEGYGIDPHCENARRLIKEKIQCPNADVQFMVGGTQANIAVITSILKHYQGAVCSESGHINTHETGALEASGHKCLTLPSHDGKIDAAELSELLQAHFNEVHPEHTVQPGIVYISYPTETGTIYSKEELINISSVCKEYELPLFIDGARLGYGLASPICDITIAELAKLCDIFYIGGTKVGALFGEAIVITNPVYQKDFRYNIKQRGGMLAKGRLLGIQFEELFKEDRYFKISEHAIAMAQRITEGMKEKGYAFAYPAETNQLFPVLSNDKIAELSQKFAFQAWEKIDDTHTCVRFVTSFMTKPDAVEALLENL